MSGTWTCCASWPTATSASDLSPGARSSPGLIRRLVSTTFPQVIARMATYLSIMVG